MPLSSLPKGCTATRSSSHIRHLASLGGNLAREANHLYMLSVRRESLSSKKRSLEGRLREINQQLKGIEDDARATEKQYSHCLGRRKKEKPNGNGRSVKAVALKF